MATLSDPSASPDRSSNQVDTLSDMLIKRGIYPGKKLYSKVRPRGLYMLLPSMWRKAKLIEQVNDYSYETLMNQCRIAIAKQQLSQQDRHEPETTTDVLENALDD